MGKWYGHYVTIAWFQNAGHVVDYNTFDVPSGSFGVERGILVALQQVRDMIEAGWGMESGGAPRVPDRVFIDAGYQGASVYSFVRESGRRYLPSLGQGISQQNRRQKYNHPKKTGNVVKVLGDQYHIDWFPQQGVFVVEMNADYWKSWLHQRLGCNPNAHGAITFFQAPPKDHMTIAKHLTSEKIVEEYIPERGIIQRWVNESRRPNHYLDAMYEACVAAHMAGFRLVGVPRKKIASSMKQPNVPSSPFADGRPWLITQRQ